MKLSRHVCQCLLLIGVILIGKGAAQANEELPLPTWDRVESPNIQPGGNFSNLLPESSGTDTPSGFFLGQPGGLNSPPLLLDDSGLSAQDLSLFLHGGLLSSPPAAIALPPTPTMVLKNVPPSVLAMLNQAPVNEYLINPQSLLTEMPALDVERLLTFHASESRIRLYILVLAKDQKLGTVAELNPLVARLGAERELCLAVYPVGEPWRARLMISPGLRAVNSLESMTEMASDCIQDAMRVNDVEQQLQRFAVRLSTRLFWLEKSLPSKSEAISIEFTPDTLFHEVALTPAETKKVIVTQNRGIGWMVGISLGTVLLAAGGVYGLRYFLKTRAARQQVYAWTLPEVEIPPRLGGAFSGGAGASISFGKSSLGKGKS
jgi:hypothetical protein